MNLQSISRGFCIAILLTMAAISNFNPVTAGANGDPTDGDFDQDLDWDCDDINALSAESAAGTNNIEFDLNGDGVVNDADIIAWLGIAGSQNPDQTGGFSFLQGDSNLDGFVDGLDYIIWNANKFTSNTDWCAGNSTGDGVIDGLDFIIWNDNKFSSAGTLP